MKIIHREFLDVNTPTCHAATIAFYKGKPVFSWFGGSREGAPDSSIYLQYGSMNDIVTPSIRILGGAEAHWNPILFSVDDDLFLSYKIGIFCDRWQTFIANVSSALSPELESKITQVIPAGLNFSVKTKPIIVGDKIYCGSSVETSYDWASYIEEYDYSKDQGFIYASRSNPLTTDKKMIRIRSPFSGYKETATKGLIQPSIWLNDDKTEMHAYMRASTGLKHIFHSCSTSDSGFRVWSKPEETELLNPNSGMDVVRAFEETYLVYNPSKFSRSPLVVSSVSEIHEVINQITITENVDQTIARTASEELSYPYMIEHNGVLHLVYTYGRSKIEYVQIEV
jgi:predicted neuraminidase